MTLRAFLGKLPVGRLTCDQARKAVVFRFDESYLELGDRPVLGRWFEDFELRPGTEFIGSGSKPPNFFRNLLPEGALRRLVEQEVPRWDFREFRLLERLGVDLPGNVTLLDDQLDLDLDDATVVSAPSPIPQGSTRFSLAGLQLKLSVLIDDKITIPVSGVGGKWIAKLPVDAYPNLPENEHFILSWAEELGLNVPEHQLYDVSGLANLPKGFVGAGPAALIVKRFDREGERRIHQEDFAQLFDLPPDVKYFSEVPPDITYQGLGRVVRLLCGEDDYEEFVRRMVFVVLSGNCDAHIKNWAVVYPDGRHSRLSPAYDMVATIAYPQIEQRLALELDGETSPYEITVEHFRRLANFAEADERRTAEIVRQFVEDAHRKWAEIRDRIAGSPLFDVLNEHLAQVRL